MNLFLREWKDFFDEKKLRSVIDRIEEDIKGGKKISPNPPDIFRVFDIISPEKVKVIIIGQDPYPDPSHAHGIAFSSKHPTEAPQSLKNIWKEIDNDINWGQEFIHTSDLSWWVKQGVLLINSHLTTISGIPGAHINYGWEPITSNIIKKLSDTRQNLVFMLWGKHAQSKENLINPDKHFILKAAHPSPLSARKGFFGCCHFSLCNTFLIQEGMSIIDWNK